MTDSTNITMEEPKKAGKSFFFDFVNKRLDMLNNRVKGNDFRRGHAHFCADADMLINLGIDRSTEIVQYPFEGIISLAPFTISSKNVIVTQWFETFPVEEEDTFTVDAEVDIGLISSNFFINFARFAERYVYPTLKQFRAKLALKSKVTFLPYVRQNITYIASNVHFPMSELYMAKDPDIQGGATQFLVERNNDALEASSIGSEDKNYENLAVQFSDNND